MRDVLHLPFDQYQRYRLVTDLLGELRSAEPLTVLDVGGRSALLRDFLPGDEVTLLDVESSQEGGLVLGDGSRLPFQDGAFDAVVACDTLEHVLPAAREGFVAECARVARRWVVLAGPFASPRVEEAEELLADFLREKLKLEHRYLGEHRAYGLPDRAEVEAQLAAGGGRVSSFGHGNLDRWLALMCMELYMDHDAGLRPLAERFFQFYNRTLYEADHSAPVYRHAVVGAFDGAPLPQGPGPVAEDALGDANEAVMYVAELAKELLVFDHEREVWQPEIERLREVVATLEADLRGHRLRLADTEADLAEHAKTLADLRATHERSCAEHGEEAATLRADLGQHAQALAAAQEASAALEADLRRQITTHEYNRAELQAHLDATQKGASKIQAELNQSRSGIEGLLVEAKAKDMEIARLRRQLDDRWKNLKRAFAPRRRR